MKPQSYKRIVAYFIDIIIVTVISSLLTFNIYDSKSYQKQTNDYVQLINDYTNQKISKKEYKDKTYDVVYNMNRETIVITIVNVVMTTIYFVVLPYFMEGATLGKKLMNLKIVSIKNDKINMNQFLIRSLLINGIIMNILTILLMLFTSKSIYLKFNDIITYTFGTFYIISFIMILYRKDGRGLHDLLGNTKVITIKSTLDVVMDKEKKEQEDNKNILKDVEIIGKN